MAQSSPSLAPALTYVALVTAFSSIFYALVIASGHLSGGGGTYVAGLMWCPACAAIATAGLYRMRIAGFIWPGRSWMAIGFLLPLGYSALAYGLIWTSGAGGFPDPAFVAAKRTALGLAGLSDAATLTAWFLLLGSAGVIQATARALGEEIGWRGFLTPILVNRVGFRGAVVATGTIWTLWHVPILLFADYHSSSPLPVAIASFTALIFGMSTVLAWLRLRSASVWPCAVLHASHNAFIQGFFTPATASRGLITANLTDEFGLMLPIVVAMVAIVIVVRDRPKKVVSE